MTGELYDAADAASVGRRQQGLARRRVRGEGAQARAAPGQRADGRARRDEGARQGAEGGRRPRGRRLVPELGGGLFGTEDLQNAVESFLEDGPGQGDVPGPMTDLTWRAEGSGEPVLMIMGLGTSALGWRRLLPHVRERYEAIVFDNRGTGTVAAR